MPPPDSTRSVATVPKGTQALDGNDLGEAFTFELGQDTAIPD
jgi:hypothetical protein